MEPGSIRVARELAVPVAAIEAALVGVRRDAAGPEVHWTLGDRGAADLGVHFRTADGPAGPEWVSEGRLWPAGRPVSLPVEWAIRTRAGGVVELDVRPTGDLAAWADGLAALLDLAHAALDECAEELLFHATRTARARP